MKKYIKNIEDNRLLEQSVDELLDEFWLNIMAPLKDDQVVKAIFKVEYHNNTYRSFSRSKRFTKDLKFKIIFKNSISSYISHTADNYEELTVKAIFIDYAISDRSLSDPSFSTLRDIINNDILSTKIVIQNKIIKDYSFLPPNMDISSWSTYISFKNGHRYAHFTYDNLDFDFNLYKDYYTCIIKNPSDGSIVLKLKDTMERHNMALDTFKRVIYRDLGDGKWNFEYERFNYVNGIKTGYEQAKLRRKHLKFKKSSS
jgi:hypothetical protein